MTGSARILVVDDQPTTVDLLATVLTGHGFAVDTAGTAAQAVEKAAEQPPDLVLLDATLPDGDGLDVRRRMRAEGSGAEVVFLTTRDTRNDLVAGLAYGDDDWITKPFDVEVLLARVRAVLRRVRADGPSAPASVLRYADLELDEDTLLVRRAGEPIPLSPTELRLLRYFLLNPRRVLSRAQLLDNVWEYDFGGDGRVLETYVSYLRKKLDAHGPSLIHTARGIGYALRLPR